MEKDKKGVVKNPVKTKSPHARPSTPKKANNPTPKPHPGSFHKSSKSQKPKK